jgi:hypothetical protein
MGHPLLVYLIDLAVQQRRDAGSDEAELRRRDRAIGLRLRDFPPRSVQQVAAWLDEAGQGTLPGRRVLAVQRVTNWVLVALGLALGWGAGQVLLQYDGRQPINVVAALSVLVGLQLLLVLFLILALLPRGAWLRLPGAGALQDGAILFSPGQLRRLARRFLPQEYRQAAEHLLAAGSAHRRLFARVEKWALVVSAQGFAVAFNVGALAACGALIAFTDLAFSWSTTLHLEAAQLHRITQTLAAPWAWLFPQAEPSLALIEATRYFRFKEGLLTPGVGTDPARLGGWWPFLVACIAFYGLGPRVVLLTLARHRYARAVHDAFRHTPGLPDVLDRLNSELVETRAVQPETDGSLVEAGFAPQGDASPAPTGRPCYVVSWAQPELGIDKAAALARRHSGWSAVGVVHAGGTNSLASDREAIERIRTGSTSPQDPVLLLVKAWEPATLEVLDFLQELRHALGIGRTIAVMPLGRDDGGALGSPRPAELQQWRQRIQAVGDPWTTVRAPGRAG